MATFERICARMSSSLASMLKKSRACPLINTSDDIIIHQLLHPTKFVSAILGKKSLKKPIDSRTTSLENTVETKDLAKL